MRLTIQIEADTTSRRRPPPCSRGSRATSMPGTLGMTTLQCRSDHSARSDHRVQRVDPCLGRTALAPARPGSIPGRGGQRHQGSGISPRCVTNSGGRASNLAPHPVQGRATAPMLSDSPPRCAHAGVDPRKLCNRGRRAPGCSWARGLGDALTGQPQRMADFAPTVRGQSGEIGY